RYPETVLPDGVPLAVWFDGDRGRIGYQDGRVISAQSRVELAPPLPSASPVRQYLEQCGRGFALAADGLWALQSDGVSPEGTWVQESAANALVSPGGSGSAGRGLDDARLFAVDGGMLLITRFGAAVEISPAFR